VSSSENHTAETRSYPETIDPSKTRLLLLEKNDEEGLAAAAENVEVEPLLSPPFSLLPVQLDVCVPLSPFRVSDLVSLECGSVVTTEWGSADDLPLWCGRVQLLWAEFEVVNQKIAVRITRLV
jgi:flagellar motor switch protein FliN/FliY